MLTRALRRPLLIAAAAATTVAVTVVPITPALAAGPIGGTDAVATGSLAGRLARLTARRLPGRG
jgi:hypothetical protein